MKILRGARYNGKFEEVYVRIAHVGNRIYVDLCNEGWQVVEIDSNGWRVLDHSPIPFIRSSKAMPLPTPQESGNLRDLLNFINLQWADFVLAVAWLIGTYMPSGPYTILIMNGVQGSSKTTTCKILIFLIDPTKPELGSPPENRENFVITAKNSWVYSMDNVTHIPTWLSDDLCRLSTGGGIAKRTLYTNDDETVLNVIRPIIINGIGDPGTRSDFLDRAIILTCPSLSNRRSEREFWKDWERRYPEIFGAVLSAVSLALRRIDEMPSDNLPRMADFARWVMAAAPALGLTSQEMADHYRSNQRDIHELALEASPVAMAVLNLVKEHGEWSGTSTELLSTLRTYVSILRTQDGFPRNGQSLSNFLMRMAPNLKAFGVDIIRDKVGTGNSRHRIIRIKVLGPIVNIGARLKATMSINPRNFTS